jgi:transposase
VSGSARFTVFGFETTHDAMRAERVLEEAGVPVVLIPTPKVLGTLCGLAARVPRESATECAHALEGARVRVSATLEMDDRTGA